MSTEAIALIVTAITTLGGLASTAILIYRARADKRRLTTETGKISADAAAVISSSAVALLEPLKAEVAELRLRLTECTAELRETKTLLHAANFRIRELELHR